MLDDLQAKPLPNLDLRLEYILGGPGGPLMKALEAIDPSNFTGGSLEAGTDDADEWDLSGITDGLDRFFLVGFGADRIVNALGSGISIFDGGAGNDTIEGSGVSLGDVVVFSVEIGEYAIEFIDEAEGVVLTHILPNAELIGDGIDTARKVERFAFDGLEIEYRELKGGLDSLDDTVVGGIDGRVGKDGNADIRDFLIGEAVTDAAGITSNGLGGNGHLVGSAFGRRLLGGDGDDILGGGVDESDVLNGGRASTSPASPRARPCSAST